MPAGPFARLTTTLQRARARLQRRPAVGRVRLGSLARATPISDRFGFDRGQCIDRFYIERFLAAHQSDIHGRVLEVQDNAYTLRFGGDAVTRSDILDVRGVPTATLAFDLAGALPASAESSFDCVILTQTLQFVYDAAAAARNLQRLLVPGGVALVTVPGISQLSQGDRDQYREYWRFTSDSMDRLFADAFGADAVRVEAHGNVLAALGFLHGLALEDLPRGALGPDDPNYEVIIAARAAKLR
jgi:SAM-dependent methyltransferase